MFSIKKRKSLILLLNSLIFIIFLPFLILNKNKAKKSSGFRNILIIELWGIGDLVMMSSILKPLKENFPQAKISLLSKKFGKALFGNSGYVDRFIEFDFPWTHFRGKYKLWNWGWKTLVKLIRQLKRDEFDLVLDARGDFRNNLLSFLSGAKRRIGYDWTGGGYFLTDVGAYDYKHHRIDTWKYILTRLGIKETYAKPFLFIDKKTDNDIADFFKKYSIKNGELAIGIHPGAGVKKRCWPLDRFAKVAEYIRENYPSKIFVFIEPDGYGDDIPIKGESFKVKMPLKELVALISKLDLLICNDSGVMHIASAVNTKAVVIFGPGDISRIGPYGDKSHIVMINEVACRPCFDNCKYDIPFCLDAIQVEDVIKASDKIIKNLSKRET